MSFYICTVSKGVLTIRSWKGNGEQGHDEAHGQGQESRPVRRVHSVSSTTQSLVTSHSLQSLHSALTSLGGEGTPAIVRFEVRIGLTKDYQYKFLY